MLNDYIVQSYPIDARAKGAIQTRYGDKPLATDMKNSKQISSTLVRQLKNIARTLTVAMNRCPDDLWNRPKTRTTDSPAWTAYHAVAALPELHMLNIPSLGFAPELENGVVASKEEVKSMLNEIMGHVLDRYSEMPDDMILTEDNGIPNARNLIYALRHTQHHVSELTQILRENGVKAPAWFTANMM